MKFRDYIDAVTEDARQVIEYGQYDNLIEGATDVDETTDEVRDELWTDDAVTGNGSGSYTFCRDTAAEYAGEVLFDEDFIAECTSAGIDLGRLLADGPEAVDVTARCLALGFAYDEIRDAVADRMERTAE